MTSRRRLILPLTLTALVSACSPSSSHQAQAAAECAAQVSTQATKEVFKVSCSSATLEQLADALQKTGRVKFTYPSELATTPLSFTANDLPLGSVLSSALQSFSYVLVREPAQGMDQSAPPAQVAISGLRGTSAGVKNGAAPNTSTAGDETAILHPIPKPSTMSAASANAPPDPDSPILHPHPQPWTTPASAPPSAAATAAAAVILHPNPQPWTMPAPKAGTSTP